jgi:hypothetical protein
MELTVSTFLLPITSAITSSYVRLPILTRNTRIDLRNFVLRRSRPQRLLRKHAKSLEDHIGRLVANRCLSVFLGGFEPQRQSPPSDLSRMAKFAMSDALPGQIPMDILPTLPSTHQHLPEKDQGRQRHCLHSGRDCQFGSWRKFWGMVGRKMLPDAATFAFCLVPLG